MFVKYFSMYLSICEHILDLPLLLDCLPPPLLSLPLLCLPESCEEAQTGRAFCTLVPGIGLPALFTHQQYPVSEISMLENN